MQYSRIGDVIEGKKLDCKIREVNSTFSPVQQPVPDPKCNTDMLIIDDADIEREFLVTSMFVMDVGDEVCWWRILVTNIRCFDKKSVRNQHSKNVTNIAKSSPT